METTDNRPHAPDDPDLGAVVLVQKPRNIGNAIFLLVLGLPMMLVVFAGSAPNAVKIGFFLFGLALAAFALWMLWRQWMRVYLHEHGIREYRQGRGRTLRYDQVDQLIYSTLRIFMNGSYIHTVQKLALKSDSMPDPPLVCTHIFREADGRAPAETRTPVVEVRDHVSRALADCLAKKMGQENSIAWTDRVRISAHGLEVSEATGGWELVEWKRIGKAAIESELLSIWVDGGDRPRLQFPTNHPNFYATWLLVTQLRLNPTRKF